MAARLKRKRDRVVTWPGTEIDQRAPFFVSEASKEAIPKVDAEIRKPSLLAPRSLNVIEGDKGVFERWAGDQFSRPYTQETYGTVGPWGKQLPR